MKWAFYLFAISFFIVTFIIAPFLQYHERETIATISKQDIRSFLESINPEILQKIDAEQKEIHIFISQPKQMKLVDLSTYPNFYNFLSFQRIGYDITSSDDHMDGFINELGQNNEMYGYYLYPRDALKK